jgi:hypothetical protein
MRKNSAKKLKKRRRKKKKQKKISGKLKNYLKKWASC